MDAANGATTKATADVTSKVTPDDPAAAADGRSPGRGATVIGEHAEKIVAAPSIPSPAPFPRAAPSTAWPGAPIPASTSRSTPGADP